MQQHRVKTTIHNEIFFELLCIYSMHNTARWSSSAQASNYFLVFLEEIFHD